MWACGDVCGQYLATCQYDLLIPVKLASVSIATTILNISLVHNTKYHSYSATAIEAPFEKRELAEAGENHRELGLVTLYGPHVFNCSCNPIISLSKLIKMDLNSQPLYYTEN